MDAFPVAPAPSADKLRGGYYTPQLLARFLSDWVAPAGNRLLEPSCGDGAILAALPPDAVSVGVEIEPGEAEKARAAAPAATVVSSDFFDWFGEDQVGAWDGVAGNPPFIRFGNWKEPGRSQALDLMREAGLRPTKLTNAWVPFVVAGVLALRPKGRLGMVVPAEILQVNYAAELRAFLVDEFAELTAVTFKRLVFDGVLQEVVLLLGTRGDGPAKIRVVEVEGPADLPSPASLRRVPHAPALLHDSEKWIKYHLEPGGIEALREARAGGLSRLGEIADVDVGLVTGRNQFFVMRPSGGEERDIARYLEPLVSKSAHLRGIRFAETDLEELREADMPCEFLALGDGSEPTADSSLASYIEAGEADGVHEGYKCSIRKNWWAVPSRWTPDAFLLRQIYDHPRIIANLTEATSTDTIHRIRMVNGAPPLKLAAASVNTATFAFSEVMGRSYGGGVLELEPREAEALPFPDPKGLTMRDVGKIDKLLREGELLAALDFVDSKLLGDLSPKLLGRLREIWEQLRDRRLARARKAR